MRSHFHSTTMRGLLMFMGTILLVVSCSRCKEECMDATNPDCPNYVPPDPCAGKGPVSADFVIEQMYQLIPSRLFTGVDNVVCGINDVGTSLIRLRPKMDGLHYRWIIGADTVESDYYTFTFSYDQCGQTFPLKLITSGAPDTVCNPLDNGMDTVVKMVRVVPFLDQELYGRYRVSDVASPLDSFEVSVLPRVIPSSGVVLNMVGFAQGCERDTCDFLSYEYEYAYNFVNVYSNTSLCGAIRGQFWLNANGLFEADYTWLSCEDDIRRARRLKGRKIN